MKIPWSWYLVVCICLCCIPGTQQQTTEPEVEEIHARQYWMQADKDLKSTVNKVIRKAMPTLMKEIYKKDISTSCLSALLHFTGALRQSKLWAYEMLDSSGRLPEGALAGTLTALGNYQECVDILVNDTKIQFKGQYCPVHVKLPLPTLKPYTAMHNTMPELLNISAPDSVITYVAKLLHNLHVVQLKIGICTPSLCSVDDIQRLVEIVPEKLGVPWKFEVPHCETKEPTHFTQSQIIVLYILGVIILVVLVGTLTDIFLSSEEMEKKSLKSTLFHVAKAFSFNANVRKMSEYTGPQKELSFVFGIMFYVLYWTAISNTFMYVNYNTTSNLFRAFEIVRELFYEIVLNRVQPLQAIFFISGLVTTYKWLKSPARNLNLWKFLLKRYLRFTPTYALVLALILMTPTWGSGPTWTENMLPIYNNCNNNWWYNLLYINNYMDSNQVCLDHTWLFAVDAQLHVLAVFVLIPLKLRPKIGLILNFILLVASLACVALTNVYYELPPNEMTAFLNPTDRIFYAEHSYYRVYTHVPLYCSGVFVAYLMHEYPNLKISKKMSCFLWLLTLTGWAAVLCSVHEWSSGVIPSPLVGAVYASMSRVAQAAMLSWLSIACMSGNARGLRDVLSWRPYIFLGRLFFIAYLMHVPIITLVQSFKRETMFVTDLGIFYIVLNHVAGTFVIAYILHIFFEAPFLRLTAIVRRSCKGRTLLSDTASTGSLTEKPVKFSNKLEVINNTWKGNSNC